MDFLSKMMNSSSNTFEQGRLTSIAKQQTQAGAKEVVAGANVTTNAATPSDLGNGRVKIGRSMDVRPTLNLTIDSDSASASGLVAVLGSPSLLAALGITPSSNVTIKLDGSTEKYQFHVQKDMEVRTWQLTRLVIRTAQSATGTSAAVALGQLTKSWKKIVANHDGRQDYTLRLNNVRDPKNFDQNVGSYDFTLQDGYFDLNSALIIENFAAKVTMDVELHFSAKTQQSL